MVKVKRVNVEMPNGEVFRLRLPKQLQLLVADALVVYNSHLRVTVEVDASTYELRYPNNGCSNPAWVDVTGAVGGTR